MATRDATKTLTKARPAAVEEPAEEQFKQRKRPESGRFHLQVDRQTKGSFATMEAAKAAGEAIKKAYPVVQVSVYDIVDSANTITEAA